MMSFPEEFVGAWRRVGLIIDGTRRVDYCDVLWLQSPVWFADIRTLIQPGLGPPAEDAQSPFAQQFSFAGTTEFIDSTEFTDPALHWIHTLDSRGQAPPDQNPVAWHDRLLVESGSFRWQGREVPFVEEWGFLGREGVTGSASVGQVRVEAAGFAIEVSSVVEVSSGVDGFSVSGGTDGFSAVKYQLQGRNWVEAGRVMTGD